MSKQFNCPKNFYFKLFKQLYITVQLVYVQFEG